MIKTYAKVDPTASPQQVVNVQVLDSADPMDPAFTWVEITQQAQSPSPGWTYDPTSGLFSAAPNVITGPVDSTQSYLHTGAATTFTSFTLSSPDPAYTVALSGNYVLIGCQTYDALWLRYALYQVVSQGAAQVGPMLVDCFGNVGASGFYVSAASAAQILAALETINFFP